MKFIVLHFILIISSFNQLKAEESEGNFIKDKRTGCTVWYKHMFHEDSVSWSGACKNGFAEGYGTLIGFTKGVQTSSYIGEMKKGKPEGKGDFKFGNGRELKGHFSEGELLNLSSECLKHLHKITIDTLDVYDLYDGDNNKKQLYYHALIPEGKIASVLILMPGTWETTEHLISSTQAICEASYKQHTAVIVLSINQRLTLTDAILQVMNDLLDDAVKRYKLPEDKIAIGGWSMGGLFSMRYTEYSYQDSSKTRVRPKLVFSCDGPCDLENIYHNFQLKKNKYPESREPQYGIDELEKYCGGAPDKVANKYRYYSCYSHEQDGGNAVYLKTIPLRIYADVDPNWWLSNRGVDMYDLNALDQTAMILFLNENGNKDAEFINSFGKGYRIEGNRHPHSWSIIDPVEFMTWMNQSLMIP